MNKHKGCHLLLGLSLCMSSPGAIADEVRMLNGDRLSGELEAANAQNVIIQSSLVGRVELPRDQVASIITDEPVTVTFNNQDQLTGRLQVDANGRPQFESQRFGRFSDFDTADIQAISKVGAATTTRQVSAFDSLEQPATPRRALQSASGAVVDADVVHLNSGDQLVGSINRMDADSITIDTEFAGEMVIPRSKVASMSTNDPVTVVFEGDEYLTGQVRPGTGQALQVQTDRAGESTEFALADVKSVYRGSPADIAREEERVKLSGNVNVGLSRSSGNSNLETYVGSGEIRARTPQNRYTARVERIFERSEGVKTEDEGFASLGYDHFLSEKWFIFNNASFERDEIEGINLRSALSAGAGYQFFEREDLFLSAQLGPSYVNEDFEDGDDSDYFAGRWAIDYDHALRTWVSLFHNQEGLFGITDTASTIIRTRSGLRFPLGNGFNATAQANIDWDRNPPEGASSTDKEYILSIGYGF